MTDLFDFVTNYIAYFSLVISVPLIIGLVRIRKLGFEQKVLVAIVFVSLVNELLATYLRMRAVNNLWVYHLFVPISFFLIARIFRSILAPTFKRRFFDFLTIAFLLFAILNSIFIQPISVFNSNVISLSSIVFIILSIAYFHQLLKKPARQGLERTPMFWLNTGLLIYYSGTLLLYVLMNYVVDQGETAKMMIGAWALNILFNVILNIFYSIVLWMNPRV